MKLSRQRQVSMTVTLLPTELLEKPHQALHSLSSAFNRETQGRTTSSCGAALQTFHLPPWGLGSNSV